MPTLVASRSEHSVEMQKSRIISDVCNALSRGAVNQAEEILEKRYPFAPEEITPRRYGPLESTRVFVRDGFIDRYSGDLLIFPPVFRVLSGTLPHSFPFHPNWKTDVTHPAYWEVGATVDHLIPVTRGGPDTLENWVTTSMARNSAKMNWTLDELGWSVHPPSALEDWGGLLFWFLDYTSAHPDTLESGSVRQWHHAAERVVAETA